MKPRCAPLLLAVLALSSACGPATPAASGAPTQAGNGIDVAGMDRSVAPGDDFFAYANGAWIKSTEIPADRSTYGAGAILTELTAQRTADLIREAAAKAPPGSEAQKVGDAFAAFMDEAGIEAKGIAPLKPALDEIAAIADVGALSRVLGAGLRADVDVLNATNFYTTKLFGLWVAQDLDDPTRYAPFLLQGGLGMPDRDYYLDASPRMAAIREKYLGHVAAVLRLAGLPDADAKAKDVVALERKIAEAHASRSASEDVHKGDNHWSRAELATRAPGIDWDAYLGAAGLAGQATFVAWQPSAVTGISALVRSEALATWKIYLAFHAVDDAATFLPKAFVDEDFAFKGGVLSGTPKLRDRWKRAVEATSDALGQAVGKLYVERYFPAAEKARVERMVANVIAAFDKRIDGLAWMAPATKVKAKAKLRALKVGVGYPDAWRDYGALVIRRDDAFGNAQRASLFELRRNLAKLGTPVDRGEWVMNPQIVDAVNLPAMNALNFPAALLQPPYLDPSRPSVMDYGSTGSVIGHEVSHSFDDQGALFDATGKLENWWTPDDFAHFKASGDKLAREFDGYHPFPDVAVNGAQTLSENIADVAGLAVAYDAYRMSLGGAEAPATQGFTGDQQFFVSFAQGWRSKLREAALRRRIVTDGHAPPEYRADTVRNLDAWYAAFDVKPGQKLFLTPDARVRVW
jgi:predicted metalloendopeptidase